MTVYTFVGSSYGCSLSPNHESELSGERMGVDWQSECKPTCACTVIDSSFEWFSIVSDSRETSLATNELDKWCTSNETKVASSKSVSFSMNLVTLYEQLFFVGSSCGCSLSPNHESELSGERMGVGW